MSVDADVHVGVRPLEQQEGVVERGQAVVGVARHGGRLLARATARGGAEKARGDHKVPGSDSRSIARRAPARHARAGARGAVRGAGGGDGRRTTPDRHPRRGADRADGARAARARGARGRAARGRSAGTRAGARLRAAPRHPAWCTRATRTSSPTPSSTPSTTRSRTPTTASGPCARSRPGSTCCARSRSRRTPPRPSTWRRPPHARGAS